MAVTHSGRRAETVRSQTSGSVWAAVINVIYILFALLEILLAFRFFLKLLAANPDASFAQAIYALSAPFVAPFQAVFGQPAANGAVLELTTLLAMAVYAVIAWVITALIRSIALAAPAEEEHEVERTSHRDNDLM